MVPKYYWMGSWSSTIRPSFIASHNTIYGTYARLERAQAVQQWYTYYRVWSDASVQISTCWCFAGCIAVCIKIIIDKWCHSDVIVIGEHTKGSEAYCYQQGWPTSLQIFWENAVPQTMSCIILTIFNSELLRVYSCGFSFSQRYDKYTYMETYIYA